MYLAATGFTAAIATPLLLFLSWSLLSRGASPQGVLGLDLLVAAIFGVAAVLFVGVGSNLGIELKDPGVVRYWTTGLTRDSVWRAEYPWESLSMPRRGFAGTWFYSQDDPFQVAGNQGDAIVSDPRYRRMGHRAPAEMRRHPGS